MQDRELSFVIPTHRLRDVGETVEEYDDHFRRNGHSVKIIVFGDSRSTRLHFTPRPDVLTSTDAEFQLDLEGLVLYPAACAPQAWTAASVFLFLQACLGLRINGQKPELSFVRPTLPHFLSELRILNLRISNAEPDLLLTRRDRRVGDIGIAVFM